MDAIKREYDPATKKWTDTPVKIDVEKKPFQEGSMRRAFIMHELVNTPSGVKKEKFVLKLSKNPAEKVDVYEDDVKMQMTAKMFAKKFNEKQVPKPVDFLCAYLMLVGPQRQIAAVEKYVAGNYVKYNNNWDWSDNKRNTPQAFSHFTYEDSGHKLLICDLQGVGDLWTDPQIHSVDQRGFGKGNMGMKGIRAFLKNHQCNAICTFLGLPKTSKAAKDAKLGTVAPRPQPAILPPQPKQQQQTPIAPPAAVVVVAAAAPKPAMHVVDESHDGSSYIPCDALGCTFVGSGATGWSVLDIKSDGPIAAAGIQEKSVIWQIAADVIVHKDSNTLTQYLYDVCRNDTVNIKYSLPSDMAKAFRVDIHPKNKKFPEMQPLGAALMMDAPLSPQTNYNINVHVLEARNLVGKESGSMPFVLIKVGNHIQRTQTVSEPIHPIWNEELSFYCDCEFPGIEATVLSFNGENEAPGFLGKLTILPHQIQWKGDEDHHWWHLSPNETCTIQERGYIELLVVREAADMTQQDDII